MNSSTTCMREVHICISALAWELCCRHNWLARRVRLYRRVVFAGRCKRQLAFAHFQQRGYGPGLLGCRRYSRRESGMFSNSLVSYFSTSHVCSTSMCQGSDTLRALGMMMYVCMHTKVIETHIVLDSQAFSSGASILDRAHACRLVGMRVH